MAIDIQATVSSGLFGGIWLKGVFEQQYFVARLYYKPSKHGINGSCIVSLTVCDAEKWDGDRQVYNYDGTLDFSNVEPAFIDRLVNDLIPYQPTEPRY